MLSVLIKVSEINMQCVRRECCVLFFFLLIILVLVNTTAKKFGVTDFVNPKDHDKPVQEVCFPYIFSKLVL